MASEEDRLDQLLKQAQQQMAGNGQTKPKVAAVTSPQTKQVAQEIGNADETAAPASFDVPQEVQDEIFSESAPDSVMEESLDNTPVVENLFGEEYQPSTENFPMKIFDEIPEEIYRKTIMADEPEEESSVISDGPILNASPFSGTVPEAEASAPVISDDPNKMMSPDDIAALVASMSGVDEATAEEPVVEEASASAVDDDPNKMMSPDDIAALVASMSGGDEAPVEEPVVAETPAPVVSDDPNKMMSPDDIAALVASMSGGDEAPVEEPVVEETPAPAVDDDPNKMMSPDDIAALVASMSGGDEAPAEEATIEEPVVEEITAPVVDDDPNKMMSPDDIAALVASMSGGDEAPAEEPVDVEAPAESTTAALEEDDPYKTMSQEEINALIGMDGEAPKSTEDEPKQDNNISEEVDLNSDMDAFDDLLGGGFDLEGKMTSDSSDTDHMGLDEIEEQLRMAAAGADEPDPLDEDTDVVSILQNLGESDPDLSDLGDYLQKSDNNELLDNSILEKMEKAGMDDSDDEEEEDPKAGKKKKEKKEKKPKKEKTGSIFDIFKKKKEPKESGTASESQEKKEKKPGFFARLLQILTTEPEEETEIPEEKQTKLSGENEAILKELDAEDAASKGKKKKEKKAKPKKEKPPKPVKEKKPKKPKKEKPVEVDNSRKIPKKYIRRTFALSFSILAAILVITLYVPSLVTLRQARNAYYDADYKTAFLSMYGKDLNDSDRLIYERSRLLVMLDRKYESYENYRAMGMRKEALDALLQGVKRYGEFKDTAKELNVAPEFSEIYIKIIAALNGDFDMTEEEAVETLGFSAVDYTGKLEAAAKGEPYRLLQDEINETVLQPLLNEIETNPTQPETNETPVMPEAEPIMDTPLPDGTQDLPDLLPEEQQYLQQSSVPEDTQQDTVLLEIPVQQNNTQIGNASSNDANVSLQIESGQF